MLSLILLRDLRGSLRHPRSKMGAMAVLDDLAMYGPGQTRVVSEAEAREYARRLAESHYENFSVLSRLLPRDLRGDFASVYAFCRWADDLGDETGDAARSLELLAWWRTELDRLYAGEPRHPVYVALRPAVERHDLPREPFDRLIDAFVQDQTVTRYETWEGLLEYCTGSADPVGRLVLYMAGHRDAERQALSDATCTALQLANLWQDVRRDVVERDRVYLPRDVAGKHGLDVSLMAKAIRLDAASEPMCGAGCKAGDVPTVGVRALQPPFRAAMRECVERTWPLFERGRRLWPLLDARVRPQVKLYTYGGEAILRLIERQRYDTMTRRPRLGAAAKLQLVAIAAAATLWRG